MFHIQLWLSSQGVSLGSVLSIYSVRLHFKLTMPLPFPNSLHSVSRISATHTCLPGQEHLHETPSTAAWACTEELLLAFEWTIWKINAIRWTLDNWIPKYLPIVFFVLLFLFSVNRGTIERATDQLLISLCRQRRNSPTVPLSSTVHRE